MMPPTAILLAVARIDEAPEPKTNRVSAAQFDALVRAIRRFGFLQPILVRPAGKRYVVVDGDHRLRAAKAAGLGQVSAVVVKTKADAAQVMGLGLNRIRGEPDMAAVGDVLADLHAADWSLEDLELTGFSPDEIGALLAPELSGHDLPAVAPPPDDTPAPKGATLKLTFGSAADKAAVVASALQFGPTIEAGLVAWAMGAPEKEPA